MDAQRDPDYNRKNLLSLMVLAALDGCISPNLKVLSLDFSGSDPNEVTAYFLLYRFDPQDWQEFIDEFPGEVETFTIGVPEVDGIRVIPIVEIASDRPPGYLPPGRRLLRFRE